MELVWEWCSTDGTFQLLDQGGYPTRKTHTRLNSEQSNPFSPKLGGVIAFIRRKRLSGWKDIPSLDDLRSGRVLRKGGTMLERSGNFCPYCTAPKNEHGVAVREPSEVPLGGWGVWKCCGDRVDDWVHHAEDIGRGERWYGEEGWAGGWSAGWVLAGELGLRDEMGKEVER